LLIINKIYIKNLFYIIKLYLFNYFLKRLNIFIYKNINYYEIKLLTIINIIYINK
jgi:hypothetical protein